MTFDETGLQPPDGNVSKPVVYNPDEFWLRTLLRWYIGLVIRPSPTIREIVERRPVWAGAAIVFVQTPIWMLIWLSYVEDASFSRGIAGPMDCIAVVLLAIVLIAVPSLPILLVLAWLLHVPAKVFGGWGGLRATFVALMMCMVVGFVPAALGIAGLFPREAANLERTSTAGNPVIASLILFGTAWISILAVIVVRHSYHLGIARSALVVIVATVTGIPAAIGIFAAYVIAVVLVIVWLDSLF